MANTVIIVDENEFGKLIRTIETLTEEVKTLSAKNNSGLKDKWLVTDEVCKMLDISKRTLQKKRDAEIIKFTKQGKKIYYKASDIEQYLDNMSA